MAGEIWSTYPEGSDLYAVIRRKADGFVYDNVAGSDTFEAWVDGNLANYVIPLTDQDGNYYDADFPAGITIEDAYTVYIFVQNGVSPADGDWVLSQAEFSWDGEEEITPVTLNAGFNQVNNVFEEEEPEDERGRIINL